MTQTLTEAETRLTVLSALALPEPAAMTDADAKRITDTMTAGQNLWRGIKTAREDTLAPMRRDLDAARRPFDMMLDRIDAAVNRLKQALLAWQRYREAEAVRVAQAAASAQAQLAAAEALADAMAAGLPTGAAEEIAEGIERAVASQVAQSIAPAPVPAAIAGQIGTASVAVTWTFEVTDEAAVPRAYLAVDLVKIGKAVRGGVRAIPGIRIYERPTIVGRRR